MSPPHLCEPETEMEPILDALRTHLPQHARAIQMDAPIAALQLDSIDLVELLCVVDSKFGVSFTIEEFQAAITVGDLVTLIHSKTNPNPSNHALR